MGPTVNSDLSITNVEKKCYKLKQRNTANSRNSCAKISFFIESVAIHGDHCTEVNFRVACNIEICSAF